MAGKLAGEVVGLMLTGLPGVFRQTDADGRTVHTCGLGNGSFYLVRVPRMRITSSTMKRPDC